MKGACVVSRESLPWSQALWDGLFCGLRTCFHCWILSASETVDVEEGETNISLSQVLLKGEGGGQSLGMIGYEIRSHKQEEPISYLLFLIHRPEG